MTQEAKSECFRIMHHAKDPKEAQKKLGALAGKYEVLCYANDKDASKNRCDVFWYAKCARGGWQGYKVPEGYNEKKLRSIYERACASYFKKHYKDVLNVKQLEVYNRIKSYVKEHKDNVFVTLFNVEAIRTPGLKIKNNINAAGFYSLDVGVPIYFNPDPYHTWSTGLHYFDEEQCNDVLDWLQNQ